MSVHPFPTHRVLRRTPVRAPDRVETMLVTGLLLTTAVQIGLCVWAWLA